MCWPKYGSNKSNQLLDKENKSVAMFLCIRRYRKDSKKLLIPA